MTPPSHDYARFNGRKWVLCLVLAALALAGNFFPLSIGFNVDFIFGSIFGLTAVVLLGTLPGLFVSLVGASYTFVLWNHPYAIIIFGCEALWVAIARRRKTNTPIFLLDLFYWVLLGIPLVFIFYFGVMQLGLRGTGIIAMKQSLNGISNAILASILLSYIPFWRWLRLPARAVRKNASIFFESMAFLLLLPCIGGLIYMNQRDVQKTQIALASRVLQSGYETNWLINEWLALHSHAVQQLAVQAGALGFKRSEALQNEVVKTHLLFPHFHNMFVGDAHATTLAFDPPVNERGESTIGLNFEDRQWFKRLKATGQPVISDVFTGRGGIFDPIITITAPVLHNHDLIGFALGAVNLGHLTSFINNLAEQSGLTVTVVDRSGKIVVTTAKERAPLETFTIEAAKGAPKIINGVFLSLPKSAKNITAMRSWKNAVLFAKAPIEKTGWTIITEGPLAPLQQDLYNSSTLNLAVIFLLLLVASGVSILISRHLSRPLNLLSKVTADIPEKIESGSRIEWPAADSLEVSQLVKNFMATADELQRKIYALTVHGEDLEATVAERTAELQRSMQEEEQAKTMLQTIFDAAPVAIVWSDQNRNIQYINPCFKNLTGYSLDEIPTLNTWAEKAYPDPDYRKGIIQKSKLAYESEELLSRKAMFEAWITCKDGEKCCCLVQTNRLQDGKYLAILSDITQRKVSEQKLDAYAIAQNVLLQEVNHRVKNNLALLVGMLNLEARHRKNMPYKEFIVEVIGRVHALSTVHSLLSSSEWKPINLRELCVKIVSSSLSGEPDSRVDISPTEVAVEASQAHNLALIINELSTNSIKYKTDGVPVRISIDITANGDRTRISYKDNGPGYPQDLIDSKIKPTGIGLQMIKGITEMSLYGSVVFSNDNGAATEIVFNRVDAGETQDECQP